MSRARNLRTSGQVTCDIEIGGFGYHSDWLMKFVAGRDLYGARMNTNMGISIVLLF